jgi:aminopeptidase
MDKRITKLAKLVVDYSLNVKEGEKILVDGLTTNELFIGELCRQILLKKAIPVTNIRHKDFELLLLNYGNKKQISYSPKYLLEMIDQTDGVIDIEFGYDSKKLNEIHPKLISTRAKATKPFWNKLLFERNSYKRTTVLLPTEYFSKDAKMEMKKYEDLVYGACFIDWKSLSERFRRINNLFTKGDSVHLIGDNVDLKFSVKGRNSIIEDGRENMPGGEIYMAPLKTSLNGWIKFEFPSLWDGVEAADIFLEFKNGEVINSKASKGEAHLRSILETDPGARFVGEFGIGIHPTLKAQTNSWLDEKISGTIHLALGKSYEENKGDNDSAVHWDLVKDMRKAKIILDGRVVQENGEWKPELLNPQPRVLSAQTIFKRKKRIIRKITSNPTNLAKGTHEKLF